MSWPEWWNLILEFLKYLAPAVITFSVVYVAYKITKGYQTAAKMLGHIMESPGRIFFTVVLFLVVWYFWEQFKVGLGW
jgi:hypothetical protein